MQCLQRGKWNLDNTYYSQQDYEYAQYQMARHHWICNRNRGIESPEPTPPKAPSADRVVVSCMHCGAPVEVMRYWAEKAARTVGGNCCKACQILRSGKSLKGRKYSK